MYRLVHKSEKFMQKFNFWLTSANFSQLSSYFPKSALKNNLKLYYTNDWWTLMENGQKRSSFTWIWTRATWGEQKSDEFSSKALPLSHGGFLLYKCRNSNVFSKQHQFTTMITWILGNIVKYVKILIFS